ncbi:sigma-70 family RNA polymerase sigma factor [Aeromicrobium sp. CF4.19]|uniref:sigma-70 family RNA polymerase sigma factor n=1 Tax=Aeromicrobium sp. CF4.19 TaxID=3373082 RepID=UPI003EE51F80
MAHALEHDDLILDHLTMASRLARVFRGRGVESEDLEQVARLALVKAAQSYDEERGAFAPFAAATIRGELKRHFRDKAWDVRPPRRLQELQAQINAEWEVHPRDDDYRSVALRLGEPAHEVREAMGARGCFTCDSTEAAQEAGHPFALEEPGFQRADEWVTFRALCRDLTDDERRLLQWRFMDEMTQKEMGMRLGISQMQVSRRLSTLLGRLQRAAA